VGQRHPERHPHLSGYGTSVTLTCFHTRSSVTLSVGNVTLMSVEFHSNVTLAAHKVTLTPQWTEFSNGGGKVLKSDWWPGPPIGPTVSPGSCAAHNRTEHDCKDPVAGADHTTRRRSALASPALLASFRESLASCTPKAAQ
jgi:hypothetical protein